MVDAKTPIQNPLYKFLAESIFDKKYLNFVK